jgi:Na+-transporting methylmalonyl-CoA/oxaloacetate decarboxylase beta subunit
MEQIINSLAQFWEYTGFANVQVQNLIMIAIGIAFVTVAIVKEWEPMLLVPIGFGILIGLGITSMMMLIWMLLFPAAFVWWYWIVSIGTFLAVMLITIWDIRNVKTYAERGELTDNLSMYLAFNLYTDFLYIFMRILYFVLMIFGRSRN